MLLAVTCVRNHSLRECGLAGGTQKAARDKKSARLSVTSTVLFPPFNPSV